MTIFGDEKACGIMIERVKIGLRVLFLFDTLFFDSIRRWYYDKQKRRNGKQDLFSR